MTVFIEWFVVKGLGELGWPRRRGVLRRTYVNSLVADTVIEQGLSVAVALGAARPELATALISDTFAGNPWTEESTTDVLRLLGQGQSVVASNLEMSPWKALWHGNRITPEGTSEINDTKGIPWSFFTEDFYRALRGKSAAQAAFWGLTNER